VTTRLNDSEDLIIAIMWLLSTPLSYSGCPRKKLGVQVGVFVIFMVFLIPSRQLPRCSYLKYSCDIFLAILWKFSSYYSVKHKCIN